MKNGIQIRMAQESEKQPLEDFLVFNGGEEWRKLAKDYISAMFSGDFRKPCFFVAEEDQKIIGAAAFSEELFTVDVWGISWVNVHPEWRNKGIGQKLVEACLKEIGQRASQPVTVILNTYPGKTRLYEKMKFQVAGNDHLGGCLMTMCVDGAAA